MEKIKFVYISEEYTNYLSGCCDKSELIAGHKEGRMFIQLPYTFNGHTYCVPLSSPKLSDYFIDRISGKKMPKPNSLQIMRVMYWSADKTRQEVKFTMRLCRMIPVPLSEIIPYDPEKETRDGYRGLVEIQGRCIEGMYGDILMTACSLYNMRVGAIPKSDSYKKVDSKLFTLGFRRAEYYCKKFEEYLEKGIPKKNILEAVMSETDGARGSESSSRCEEQPGCSTWGVSSSRHGEDEYRYSDSPDGGRKRKHREDYNDGEPKSVRRRVSESRGESSRSSYSRCYSGKGKGLGKGRSRRTPTR